MLWDNTSGIDFGATSFKFGDYTLTTLWATIDNTGINIPTGSAYKINGSPLTSGGAPTTATYILETPNVALTSAFSLSTLATGILRNTTTTGVPVIAVPADFPILNQSTTGNANTATKFASAVNINGVAFDGSASIVEPAASVNGQVPVYNGTNWIATNFKDVFQSGQSTSGTAGTNLATITASGTTQFVAIVVFTRQGSAATTTLTITYTYADLTQTTYTTAPTTAEAVECNAGACLSSTGNLTQLSNKAITSVAVTTSGAGTGNRLATVSAIQIPR
jgi:hypothetical protein